MKDLETLSFQALFKNVGYSPTFLLDFKKPPAWLKVSDTIRTYLRRMSDPGFIKSVLELD